jgi:hypothetical protein
MTNNKLRFLENFSVYLFNGEFFEIMSTQT